MLHLFIFYSSIQHRISTNLVLTCNVSFVLVLVSIVCTILPGFKICMITQSAKSVKLYNVFQKSTSDPTYIRYKIFWVRFTLVCYQHLFVQPCPWFNSETFTCDIHFLFFFMCVKMYHISFFLHINNKKLFWENHFITDTVNRYYQISSLMCT